MQKTTPNNPLALQLALIELELTQVELARLIDYSAVHVNDVLRGRERGSSKFWRACARVLDTKTEVA